MNEQVKNSAFKVQNFAGSAGQTTLANLANGGKPRVSEGCCEAREDAISKNGRKPPFFENLANLANLESEVCEQAMTLAKKPPLYGGLLRGRAGVFSREADARAFSFSVEPPVGMILRLDAQRYELAKICGHTRSDGLPTFILTWETCCPRCGATFEHTTGLTAGLPIRRCPDCRKKKVRRPVSGKSPKRRVQVTVEFPPDYAGDLA